MVELSPPTIVSVNGTTGAMAWSSSTATGSVIPIITGATAAPPTAGPAYGASTPTATAAYGAGTLPVSVGTAAQDNDTPVATRTLTTTAAIGVGDAILIAFAIYRGVVAFSSVTDGTNTYSVVHVAGGNGIERGIAYCPRSAGLPSGSTISVNLAGVPGAGYFAGSAFSVRGGLDALDVSTTAAQSSASALSVGPTGSTAKLVELVLAAFGGYNGSASLPSFTVGAGYTALTPASAVGAGDAVSIWPQYLVTAAAAAQTATATLGASITSIGDVIAAFTYPAGAAAGTPTAGPAYSAGTPTAVAA